MPLPAKHIDFSVGCKDIFNQYIKYRIGRYFTFTSSLYYAYYGHFYSGKYLNNPACANFIKLINRLSLINPQYLQYFNEALFPEGIELNETHFEKIADNLYEIFQCVERDYFEELKEGYQISRAAFKKNTNLSEADLDEYENITYKDEKEIEGIVSKLKNTNEKLACDFLIIREQMQKCKLKINYQLKGLKKDINHVIQDMGIGSRIIKSADREKQPYKSCYEIKDKGECEGKFVSEDKKNNRKIKAQNKFIGKWAALLVGLGEGLVATAGIVVLIPSAPFFITFMTVGLAGWYCNFFLFRDDTEATLRDLRIMKVIKDKDGKEIIDETGKQKKALSLFVASDGQKISGVKLVLSVIFGLGSFGTGLVYGSLSFLSVLAALPASLGVFASVLAAFPAAATAIGITSILYRVITNFIKNDKWKDVVKYFNNTFLNRPWKKMTKREWAEYAFHVMFNILKLSIGLSVNVVITVVSLAMLHDKAFQFLGRFYNAKISNFVGWIAAALNAIVHAPFGIQNVLRPIEKMFPNSRNLYTKIEINVKSEKTYLNSYANKYTNTLKGIGWLGAILNGCGQAALVAAQMISSLSKAVITGISGLIYSAGPNKCALEDTLSNGIIISTTTCFLNKKLFAQNNGGVKIKNINEYDQGSDKKEISVIPNSITEDIVNSLYKRVRIC